MKVQAFLFTVLFTSCFGLFVQVNAQTNEQIKDRQYSADSTMLRTLYDQALTQSEAYTDLEELCTDVGSRLSGSAGAEKAVYWAEQKLKAMGCDSVWLQPVMVPHWERGAPESAQIHMADGKHKALPVCALGGSVGTSAAGIRAEIVEVFNFEDLDRLGREGIEGKIVLFNRPMEPRLVSTFEAYSGCVNQRSSGASKASRYGALAVLVRSMNLRMDDLPHTGVMGYEEGVVKIPAAAISTNAAAALSNALREGKSFEVELKMNCENFDDAASFNVIGQINGSVHPDRIMVVGGHLDSWDLGQGAHDDGAGVVQSMEVLRAFKRAGIKPQNSLRCVLFMNEENGAKGAKEYAAVAKKNGEKHVLAIESDRGGFTPRGFTVDPDNPLAGKALDKMRDWDALFKPYGIHYLEKGFSGVDVSYLKDQGPILMGLVPDSQRYFDYHHAKNDLFDAVNRRELELGAVAMVSLIYLVDKSGFLQFDIPNSDF
ncbi:MAG: hypothetical protein ACI959_001440 [Limisphaerales bacterium]|jgi:hypothetical protein